MKMLGTAMSKKEDRMQESAKLMLKAGNFQEYCNIMMSLDRYEEAIAVAPKVSLRFWQKCVDSYRANLVQDLEESQNLSMQVKARDTLNELVDFSIVSGNYEDAADVLHKHG